MSSFVVSLFKQAGQNAVLLFKCKDGQDDDGSSELPVQHPHTDSTAMVHAAKDASATQPVVSHAVPVRNGIEPLRNPITLIAALKSYHLLAFITAFTAMLADFLDFYALTTATKKIAAYFDTTKTEITTAVTYTMLCRFVGAVLFGALSDLVGRKWPLVANLTILGVLQIASIYTRSLGAFLATRALFGIGMGGIWGLAAAQLMEQCPAQSRGLLSGLLQSAISAGFIVAAGINLATGPDPQSWKVMFWIGAGISFATALLRACLPESSQFIEATRSKKLELATEAAQAVQQGQQHVDMKDTLLVKHKVRKFSHGFAVMIRLHWPTFFYSTILVCLSSWAFHAFLDSYTSLLIVGKGMSNRQASICAIIAKIGGLFGNILGGYLSQSFGRRRTFALGAFGGLCLLPAAILPDSKAGLAAGGFFVLLLSDMTAGVLPVHLNELSPVAFRAIMSGSAYQLGNAIAAPSTQIANAIAESHFVMLHGKRVEAYAPTIGITTALLLFLLTIWAAIGPEHRGRAVDEFVPAALQSNQSSLVELKAVTDDRPTQSLTIDVR